MLLSLLWLGEESFVGEEDGGVGALVPPENWDMKERTVKACAVTSQQEYIGIYVLRMWWNATTVGV